MAYGARPVPQNIMTVEFKLFDFMTLKQFILSFVVIGFAALMYFLFAGAWKVVAPLFTVIIGGIVIFVPFNGEPFQEFLSSYLEAMVSPQRRVWHRKGYVVSSAVKAAKFYQYGVDGEEANTFKFPQQSQEVKVAPEQKTLDKQEDQFLQSPSTITPQEQQEAQQTQQMNISVSNNQPQQQSQAGNVSARSVQTSVNIQQYQRQPQSSVHQNPAPTPQEPTFEQQVMNSHDSKAQEVKPEPVVERNEVPESVKELNDIMPPKKDIVEDDEFAVKNFIFGGVEDHYQNPIPNAAVVVKKGGENLEVVYTNENGDFQTRFEYKAGEYTIYVNQGAEEFNVVTIEHDPINPVPIIIIPKTPKPVIVEEVPEITSIPGAAEVFDGAYDPFSFNLGADYDELDAVTSSPVLRPTVAVQTAIPETVEASEVSVAPMVLNEDDDDIDYEKIVHEFVSQKDQDEILVPPVVQSDVTPANKSISEEESLVTWDDTVTKNYMNDHQSQPQNNVQTFGSGSVATDTVAETYDFSQLPDSNLPFDPTVSHIQNTINGNVVDSAGNSIVGVLVNIFNDQGKVVRTIATDPEGKFYTFAPIPVGTYSIQFFKPNYSFSSYMVVLQSSIISPKVVQSLN